MGSRIRVALATLVLTASAGSALAQVKNQDVVSDYGVTAGWKIRATVRNGEPYACNALPPGGAGRISDFVRYVKDDKTAVLVANMGLPVGVQQQGSIEAGRASELVTVSPAPKGVKDRIWLSAAAEAMLRQGGTATLQIGGRRFDIPTAGLGQVMGATADCVNAMRKSGGAPGPAVDAGPATGGNTVAYCDAYAKYMASTATRGVQMKCESIAKASTSQTGYYDWCMRTPKARVDEERGMRQVVYDGCAASAGGVTGDQTPKAGVMPNPSAPQLPKPGEASFALQTPGYPATVRITIFKDMKFFGGAANASGTRNDTVEGRIYPDGRIVFTRRDPEHGDCLEPYEGRFVGRIASGTHQGCTAREGAIGRKYDWTMTPK